MAGFKGFGVSLPEYEVLTPQTHQTYTVRSLNVQEEETLKGSLISPTSVTKHLNECLFKALVKKPEGVKDLDSFLKALTMKDRDALLYGLYHITYEDIRNYDITCSRIGCDKKYSITLKISDAFDASIYEGKNVLTKKVNVPLPVTKGVTAIIKQPTCYDEISYLNQLSTRPGASIDLITNILIIDHFEQDQADSKEKIIYNDLVDILDAYTTLPPRDRRTIFTAYDEEFGKSGVNLKFKSKCQFCGYEDEVTIDLVNNFFRSLYSG